MPTTASSAAQQVSDVVLAAALEEQHNEQQALKPVSSRRRRLWELATGCHCMIVGTCLTLQEVESICKKSGYTVVGKSDYDLHRFAVSQAEHRDSTIARRMQKLLEKKYRADIRQFQRAKTPEALAAIWTEQVAKGRVPGAVWATATHNAVTVDLIQTLYGEVHMMSHFSGAAVIQKISDVPQLAQKIDSLTDQLTRQSRKYEQRDKQQRKTIDDLTIRNAELRGQCDATQQQLEKLDGADEKSSAKQIASLNAALDQQRWQNQALEQSHRADRQRENQQSQSVIDKLEWLIGQLIGENGGYQSDSCQLKLNGKCVLLLGCKSGQCRHFRHFVEASDGEFLHHDGGLESNYSKIDNLVQRADAVLCPVEHVSHSAMLRAKKLCRKAEKPMVFMPRASLSSFMSSLEEIPFPTVPSH